MEKSELKQIDYQSLQKENQWTDEELKFVIKKNCECDNCGKNVESSSRYAELLIEDDLFLCEECYYDENLIGCPICEDYYKDNKSLDEGEIHCYIGKEFAESNKMKGGIYKVLSFPIFYGDCLTGFDAFYDDSLELVKEIDINSVEKTDIDISADFICPDCVSKYINKNQ